VDVLRLASLLDELPPERARLLDNLGRIRREVGADHPGAIEEPDSEHPFVLPTGRTLYHYNSATMTMREGGITDKQVDPFFEIAREDASERPVSRRGDIRARTRLSGRVHPGLVWMALRFAEAKVNLLAHHVADSPIGPECKVSAVRPERV
jgi:predicted molibdopterin-dependent oxidoreductase YjgC